MQTSVQTASHFTVSHQAVQTACAHAAATTPLDARSANAANFELFKQGKVVFMRGSVFFWFLPEVGSEGFLESFVGESRGGDKF